jgi:predicted XRE-type DNA-binding protein
MKKQTFASVWDAIESGEEAANLKIRSKLMSTLCEELKRRKLSQAQAAKLLGVTQPRVSDLTRGRIDLFSIDVLVNMLYALGVHADLGSWFAVARGAFRQPEPGDPEKNHVTTYQIQTEKPMNTTSAQSKRESRLESQQKRDARIDSEVLKKAVAEGKIKPWTAVHICRAKVPPWLQATLVHSLKGTVAKRLANDELNEPPKMTAEDRRKFRMAKRGSEALKRALKEGRITKGLSGEIVNEAWPHGVQAFFCSSLFGYEIDLVETKKE